MGFSLSPNPNSASKKDTTICKNQNLSLFANIPTLAQPSSYSVNTVPYIETLPCESAGSVASGTSISFDDRYSGIVPIGFNFCFYNQNFSNVTICDNGFMTFSTNKANTNLAAFIPVTLPLSYTPTTTTVIPQNTIFGAFFDLLLDPVNYNPPGSGSVTTQVVGTAPYRAFIVKFVDCRYYLPSCRQNAAVRLNMKMVLYETTNIIDVYIKTKPICGTVTATQGIMGTSAAQVVVTPGRNNSLWNGDNTAVRYTPNGTPYNFTLQWSSNGSNLGTSATQPVNNFNQDSAWFVAQMNITATCPASTVIVRDSIKVRGLNNLVSTPIRNDTIKCADSINLNANNVGVLSYLWNNNSTANNRTVNSSGLYSVIRKYDFLGCSRDTLKITVVKHIKPKIDSIRRIGCFTNSNTGQVRLLCSGDTTGIQSGINLQSLSNGSLINSQGYGSKKYYVKNSHGCIDSITVFHDSLVSTFSKRNTICTTDSTGLMRLVINPGPNSPYYWTLNNAQTRGYDSFNKLTAGIYTIVGTDKNGCSISVKDTLKPSGNLSITLVRDSVKCFGGNTGSIAVSMLGSFGTAPFSYSINGGGYVTSNIFTNLTAGNYLIRVRDVNGCQGDSNTSIAQYPQMTATRSQQKPCLGFSTGTIVVNALGGNPGYQFRINTNPFQSNSSLTNVSAGINTVSIRDANNCILNIQDTMLPLPKPDFFINNYRPIPCNGGQAALRAIQISGSQAPYTYAWSNGGNLDSIVNIGVGVYQLTVTDNNGCKDTAVLAINQPTLISATVASYHPLCFGSTNGSLKINASGGTPPYSYSLDGTNYNSIDSITGLSGGSYFVRVKDNNNCVRMFGAILNTPSPLTLNLNIDSVKCFGGNDGRITVNSSGGTGTVQYALGAGGIYSTNNIFNNLSIGSYLIKSRDGNLCQKDSLVQVYQYPQITISTATLDTISCRNGSNGRIQISASGGNSPFTYALNTGTYNTSNIFANLNAGAYILRAKDANNCIISSAPLILSNPAGMTSNLSILSSPLCYGQSNGRAKTTVNGGMAPYSFNWSSGSTLDSATNLSAGNHYIVITDMRSCKDSTSFNLSQPDSLSASFNLMHPRCYNLTGSIKILSQGGVNPYSFSFNSGSYTTVDSAQGLSHGIHQIVLRDANNCSKSFQQTLINPAQLVTSYLVDSVKCFGGNNGKITINASGGTGILTYRLNGNPMPSNQFTNLTAGSYLTQVRDANNCNVDSNINVHSYLQINRTKNPSNISCFGTNTGSLSLSASGGNPPYFYQLNSNPFVSSGNFTNLVAGIYSTSIQDANLCVRSWQDTILQIDSLIVSHTLTNNLCHGDTSGTIKLNVSGGTPPYSYAINGGSFSNTDSFTKLKEGVYNIEVKDINNCIKNKIVTLIDPPKLSLVAFTDSIKCNKTVLGKIDISANGGTGLYSHFINSNFTPNSGQANITYPSLAAGTYAIRVRDMNQCTRDTNIVLYNVDSFYFSFTLDSITCNNLNNGKITVISAGGGGNYQYQINQGAFGSSNIISGLVDGPSTITVKDAYNCSLTKNYHLPNPALLVIDLDSMLVNKCFGQTNGKIYPRIFGGSPPLNFTWSNLNTSLSNTNLVAGTYTLTVSDRNGCSTTRIFNITEPSALVLNFAVTNVRCINESNGRSVANVSGGTGSYGYRWQDNSISNIISDKAAGSYSITVTDENNCTISGTTSIPQPADITYNLFQANSHCQESKSGVIELQNVLGGNPPYTYSWTNNVSQTNLASKLAPHFRYSVTLTDSKGCQKFDSAYIDTNYVLRVQISNTNPNCKDSRINLNIQPLSGTNPITYKLGLDSNLTGVFTNVMNNIYKIVVRDSANCTYTEDRDMKKKNPLQTELINYPPLCESLDKWSSKVKATGGQTPYTYSWPGAYLSINDSAIHNKVGSYTVHVTDGLGCIETKNFVLTELTDILRAVIVEKVNLRCNNTPEGELRIEIKGGRPPYNFLWSNGQTSKNATKLSANKYYEVTVSDGSGCKYSIGDSLTEPTALTMTHRKKDETCHKKSDASIIISAQGGTPFPNGQYRYALDTHIQTEKAFIPNIKYGQRLISVIDANKCIYSENVYFVPGPFYKIESDTTYWTELGNSIQILPTFQASANAGNIEKINWEPGFGLSCTDCSDPFFSGYTDQNFVVTVLHSSSCQDTAIVKVRVRNSKPDDIYIPNAFTPTNNSQYIENRTFRAFGFNIANFELEIFNRWGEKVFASDHIETGWDGTYKNADAEPGVYTYKISYTLLDQRKYIRQGSLTLIR